MSTSAQRRRPLRALAHRDFRLLAVGNLVSQLGFWGQYIAVGWVARSLTSWPFMITFTFAAQWIPSMVLSPIAGVLADRYDRRKLVLYGNLVMMVPPAVIGVLIQTGHLRLWNLLLLVLAGGAAQAFTQPAASSLIPALVPHDDVHSAIALNSGMSNSTRILGPSVAGWIIAGWGVAWGFHVNAISFLAVSWACVLVRARPPRPEPTDTGMMENLRLGFAYTRANPAVARLLALTAITAFLIMHAPLMPIFARDVLGGGVGTYSLLSTATGVGFVGAAILTTVLVTGRQRRAALVVCSVGVGVSLTVLGLSRVVALSVVALGVFGMCFMTVSTIVTTMLITATDDEYRGRVMGVYSLFAVGTIPINSLLAGVLASAFGAANTVVFCGLALLASFALYFATGSLGVIRARTESLQPVGVAAAT